MPRSTDEFTRDWITKNALQICAQYEHGVLTLRGLHYQLVGLGMTNSVQHYKRVVSAMIVARRGGLVAYSQFSDHDREKLGNTQWRETSLEGEVEKAKQQIRAWMTNYSRNRWENQPTYLEVWVEKKALQGTFQPITRRHNVALCPCKGYPSLTFLHEASQRFEEASNEGKHCVIAYFGDHDPSGEDIPRSIGANMAKDFFVDVEMDVRALTAEQAIEMELPPAPTKAGDSRSANFTGIGQVELDAIPPQRLQAMIEEAIEDHFDAELGEELDEAEEEEGVDYKRQLREYVESL